MIYNREIKIERDFSNISCLEDLSIVPNLFPSHSIIKSNIEKVISKKSKDNNYNWQIQNDSVIIVLN